MTALVTQVGFRSVSMNFVKPKHAYNRIRETYFVNEFTLQYGFDGNVLYRLERDEVGSYLLLY